MQKVVKELIEESIKKWEERTKSEPRFPTVRDCPLCQMFHRSGKFYTGERDQTCRQCPVYKKTGRTGCEGTPVDDYSDAYDKYAYDKDEKYSTECQLIAVLEVEFLKGLLEGQIEMDEKNKLALCASITHWMEFIEDPENTAIGVFDCALCQLYHGLGSFYTRHPLDDENCKGCPIKERTGQINCRDTPYVDVKNAHSYEDWKNAKEYGKEELEFLKSFLGDVEYKPVTMDEFIAYMEGN